MSAATVRTVIVAIMLAIARVAASQVVPEIVPLAENLYLVRAGDQATVYMVSGQSILLADPLDLRTAEWLRNELAERYPGRSVRYIVHTSQEFSRASGELVFTPDAMVFAHERFNTALIKSSQSLPPEFASLDRNRNGQLDPDEWRGAGLDARISAADADHNDTITAKELFHLIPYATKTFRESLTLTVGQAQVQIANSGGAFTTTALFFPAERVLFTGSNRLVNPTRFSFGELEPRRAISWLHRIADVPFESIVTSDATRVSRADFDAIVRYADALISGTVEAYAQGRSQEGAVKAFALDAYVGSAIDATRRANVSAIYRSLHAWRMELQAASFVRRVPSNETYCVGFDSCVSGARIGGGGGAVRITRSRLGVIFELTYAGQFSSERDSRLIDEAFVHRSSRASLLFRYGGSRSRGLSFDLLGGPTWIVGDTKGANRVKEAAATVAGRHLFAERSTKIGWTAGVNVVAPITSRVSAVVPLRVTRALSTQINTWPNPLDIQVGIGLAVRVTQRVR